MYRIKNEYSAGLPLPLIERYRTSDGPALKAALWFILNGTCSAEKLSVELSIPLNVADRVISFWLDAGLIEKNDNEAPISDTTSDELPETVKLPQRKISTLDLSDVLLRDSDLATLLQASQEYLLRPLTTSESSKLANIYLETGLPAEVLLMIVAYSKSRAKRGVVSYIAKIANQWADDGINTAEKAEKHLRLLEIRELREMKVADILESDGSFTYREKQYISIWYEDYQYGDDFVREAYLHAGKPSVAYINGILKAWHAEGIKTVAQTRLKPSNAQVQVKKKPDSASGGSLIKKAANRKRTGSTPEKE